MDYLLNANETAEWLIKSEEILKTNRYKFILKNSQSPGDVLLLTSCVRDVKRWYPHVELAVETSTPQIWENNPYIDSLNEKDSDVTSVDMQYEIIHESNQNMDRHFIHGFIHDFNAKLGFSVKLTEFKPDIHLTDYEKNTPVFDDQPDKFVVLVAGGKNDFKSKWWWKEGWTDVVKGCPDVKFIQVGRTSKSKENNHIHDMINEENCINKLDKTSDRELIRLVYQSVGTLSVVTLAMHLAAAFDKHAAVIAGGHEPWWWEKYPGHDYFHTIGRLECCRYGGCWKGSCENLNENKRQKCLELINPQMVSDAINKWFE